MIKIMGFNRSILKMSLDTIDDPIMKQQIRDWIKLNVRITNFQISDKPNSDGKYVVDASIVVFKSHATSLTNDLFVWGKIDYGFNCSETAITSLKGAPYCVNGLFDCSHTNITSLKNSPKHVGSFYCTHTKITSLKGSPNYVSQDFDCSYTDITSLQGGPFEVGRTFNCNFTKITSLDGAPKILSGDIYYCGTNIKQN